MGVDPHHPQMRQEEAEDDPPYDGRYSDKRGEHLESGCCLYISEYDVFTGYPRDNRKSGRSSEDECRDIVGEFVEEGAEKKEYDFKKKPYFHCLNPGDFFPDHPLPVCFGPCLKRGSGVPATQPPFFLCRLRNDGTSGRDLR